MKKIMISLLIIVMFSMSLIGCGDKKAFTKIYTDEKSGETIVNRITYDTYGLFNEKDIKHEQIQYEVIWGNVALGIFLCETIIAPIYFFGYSLFEPVGLIANTQKKLEYRLSE